MTASSSPPPGQRHVAATGVLAKSKSAQQQGPTINLVFAVVVITLGTWFVGGFFNIVLNIPQSHVVKWVRRVECSRRHPVIPVPATNLDNQDSIILQLSYQLWCGSRTPQEEAFLLRDNARLRVIWSVLNAAAQIGTLLSTGTCTFWLRRLGLRGTLYLASACNLVGALLSGLVNVFPVYEFLAVGRLFSGIAFGLAGVTASMYIAEITPTRLRGAAGTAPMVYGTMQLQGDMCQISIK